MISPTVVHQNPDDDDHSDTSDSDSDEDSNQETPNLPKAASGEDSVEESENDDFEDGPLCGEDGHAPIVRCEEFSETLRGHILHKKPW